MDLFSPVFYTAEKIDGDYVLLRPESGGDCVPVARAFLPVDVEEHKIIPFPLSFRRALLSPFLSKRRKLGSTVSNPQKIFMVKI